MLTLKHNPIIDKEKGTIKIWDDVANDYEEHSFEFIESLFDLIQATKLDELDFLG